MNQERLIAFLYILVRDHISVEAVQEIIKDHVDKSEGHERIYSSDFIHGVAVEVAKRLK